MTVGHGKPIFLTQGERRLLIAACSAQLDAWAVDQAEGEAEGDRDRANLADRRRRQFKRIIRELIEADPEPKEQ